MLHQTLPDGIGHWRRLGLVAVDLPLLLLVGNGCTGAAAGAGAAGSAGGGGGGAGCGTTTGCETVCYVPEDSEMTDPVAEADGAIKEILEKTVGKTWKDWAAKLDDALWAYSTAFKTPLGTTPFHLLYGKPCHLPVEIKHKAAWAIKLMNFDIKSAAERRLIQLNELDEIRHHAYENSKLYKERTKAYHDSKILSRQFEPNDQVLLYNSRLQLFPDKLRSRWSGPFIVKEVRPFGAIVLLTPDGSREFTVNGQRVKHYWAKAEIPHRSSGW
ncbi:uncharacterized protein LOC112087337 [Eutrema salsugineum]|uniref:uncharacterized protein LOC112087337 n=1 Tax=Eutrema salsugineum TaxID=72664 RepID=UPI000CED3687|nr:uncharacterized protein LOC112087337 [Eutrema salsugineum]